MTIPFKTRGGLIAAVLVVVCLLCAGLALLMVPKPTAVALGENPTYLASNPNVLIGGVLASVAALLAGLAVLWELKVVKNQQSQGLAVDDVMKALGLGAQNEPQHPAAAYSPAGPGSGGVSQEIDTKWKEGVAIEANAYNKPWYVLCGETGTGKSNLLARGELPMARSRKTGQELPTPRWEAGTLGLDWWFFEQSVVLDTAGNLLTDHGTRWLNFLKKVKTVRPAEPINGMIVAVSAQSLQDTPPDLEERVRHIAGQMATARQILGVRFPVYVLITKADLVGGFSEFFPVAGDPRVAHQIMGWSNPENPLVEETAFRAADIKDHLQILVDRLKHRRSMMITAPAQADDDSSRRVDHLDQLYAFPENVLALADNLRVYLEALIPPNQGGGEFPPFFRGVYLTSSRRTGEALDRDLAEAFGMAKVPKTVSVASERSFFIKDLLTNKIIAESGLVTPMEAVRDTFKHRRVAVLAASAAAAVLVLAATGLGITQLSGKIKPHRDYWKSVAATINTSGPDTLALYDAKPAYRGAEILPASDRSVLDVQETNARLINQDTASWLLPMSGKLDAKRRDAHRALYFRKAVFPAIDAAVARLPADAPEAWGANRVAAMNALAMLISQNEPRSTAAFAELAAATLKGAGTSADERAASGLFAADAGWPRDDRQTLDPAMRQQLATRFNAAVTSWAKAQVDEEAWKNRLALMDDINRAAEVEQKLTQAVKADASVTTWSAQRARVDGPALRPVRTDHWGDLDQAVRDAVQIPPRVTEELDLLTSLFPEDAKDAANIDARAAVETARQTAVAAADSRRATMARVLRVSPSADVAALEKAAQTYQRRYVGRDWSAPTIARRIDAYQAVASAAAGVSEVDAIKTCKYANVEAALIAADAFAARAAKADAPRDAAADPLDRDADQLCRTGVASVQADARRRVWDAALSDPVGVWSAPDRVLIAVAPDAPIVDRAGPLGAFAVDAADRRENVEKWLADWARLRDLSQKEVFPPETAGFDAAVDAYRQRVVDNWTRQVAAWAEPGDLKWLDIQPLDAKLQKPAEINQALRRVQAERDAVYALLGRPASGSAAGSPGGGATGESSIGETAKAIRRIAAQEDAVAARKYLITLSPTDLPEFDAMLARIKTGGLDLMAAVNDDNDLVATYWADLSTAVLRGIVDANRPNLHEALKTVAIVAKSGGGTFPFVRGGGRSATNKDFDTMDKLARLLRPSEDKIRTLPPAFKYVLSPGFHDRADWDAYLSGLSRVTAAVKQNAAFVLEIQKPAGPNNTNQLGVWNAIQINYVSGGRRTQYGPIAHDFGTNSHTIPVSLNEAPDIKLFKQMAGDQPSPAAPILRVTPTPTTAFWLYRMVDARQLTWKPSAQPPAYEGDLTLEPTDPQYKAGSLRVRLIPADAKPLPDVLDLPK